MKKWVAVVLESRRFLVVFGAVVSFCGFH